MTEAEQGIIGSILLDDKCIGEIYGKLEPKMFSDDFGKTCFNEILAMYDTGNHISHVELAQRIENHKWSSQDVGKYLAECVVASPTSVLIKNYADTVIREYKANELKNLFGRCSLLPRDIDNTMAEIIAKCEELKTGQEIRSKSIKQISQENKVNYFVDIERNTVKTGFYKLDDCLGGLEGGDVIVIGARPGVGKSAISLQMITHMCKTGNKVGYFNLEMMDNQVYERLVSQLSEIGLTRVRRAKSFLGGEKGKFDKANNQMEQMDLIISSGSKTIGEIKSESRHQNFDVIVIDYLQLVKAERKYGNRASEVGDISKAVKELASELKVPVVLLSQLNRTSEVRDTKEPEISELRESGDIEQDASVILLMWNLSEKNPSLKGLKVGKQRMGELSKFGLEFDGAHMRFEERMEDFSKTLQLARNCDKGTGIVDDCPFG